MNIWKVRSTLFKAVAYLSGGMRQAASDLDSACRSVVESVGCQAVYRAEKAPGSLRALLHALQCTFVHVLTISG